MSEPFSDGLFSYATNERKQHEKIRKPVKQIVIGTYQSMKAASKQVDLLMRGNGDLCVNIVQDGRKYQVRTVVWQ